MLRLVFCFVLFATVIASSKIDSSLLEVLNSGKTARLTVSMTACPEELENAGVDDKTNTVDQEALNAYARRCQATVLQVLEAQKNRVAITWESLWPDQTLVNGADLQLANDIAALSNVAKVEGEKFVDLL